MNEIPSKRLCSDTSTSMAELLSTVRSAAMQAFEEVDPDARRAAMSEASDCLAVARHLAEIEENERKDSEARQNESRKRNFLWLFGILSIALLIVMSLVRMDSVVVDISATVTSMTFRNQTTWTSRTLFNGRGLTVSGFSLAGASAKGFQVQSSPSSTQLAYLDSFVMDELRIEPHADVTMQQTGNALTILVSPLKEADTKTPLALGYFSILGSKHEIAVTPAVSQDPIHLESGERLYFLYLPVPDVPLRITINKPNKWEARIENVAELSLTDRVLPAPIIDGETRYPSSIQSGDVRIRDVDRTFKLNLGDDIAFMQSASALFIKAGKFLDIEQTARMSEIDYESFGRKQSLKPTLLDWVIKHAGVVQTLWALLTIFSVFVAWFLSIKRKRT